MLRKILKNIFSLHFLINFVQEKHKNLLVKNSAWVLSGQIINILIQSLYFIILARILGAKGYGIYAAALAYTYQFFHISGLGSSKVLVMNVSRNRDVLPKYLGSFLLIQFISGSVLTIIGIALSSYILDKVPISIVIWLLTSELIFGKIFDGCLDIFQALENLKARTIFSTIKKIGQLTAVLFYFILLGPSASPLVWVKIYSTVSIATGTLSVIYVILVIGKPIIYINEIGITIQEGIKFVVGLWTETASNEIDKIIISRESSLAVTGMFSAASRAIDMSLIPISAILIASDPRLFREGGSSGIKGTLSFARKIFPIPLIFSVLLVISFWFLAPLLPYILGEDFQEIVLAIRLLAGIPIIKTINYMFANTLMGAGYQGTRAIIRAIIVILSITLNIILISRFDWIGAVITLYISQGLFLISLIGANLVIYRKEKYG